MQSYQSFICYRKHFFTNQTYLINFTDNLMTLTNPTFKSPKYTVELNWSTQISWQLRNKEFAIGFMASSNKFKWFHGKQKDIIRLKQILSKMVSFTNFNEFYEQINTIAFTTDIQIIRVRRISDKNDNLITKCINQNSIQTHSHKILGFEEELNNLREIHHPSFLAFEEFFVTKEHYNIVMEYCQGQTLSQYIENQIKHQLNWKIIQNICSECLCALQYLHSLNIIHRDIKPENIILNIKENEVKLKIVGFGRSVKIIPGKELKRCGTPGYVAPEIIKFEDGPYGLQSDMFSMGCVFYKLFVRKELFNGTTQSEILSANRKCNFNLSNLSLIHIPLAAQRLLSDMLQEDPRLRITPERALWHFFFKEELKASNRSIQLRHLDINLRSQSTKQQIENDVLCDYFNSELPPVGAIPVFESMKTEQQDQKTTQEYMNSYSTNSKCQLKKQVE